MKLLLKIILIFSLSAIVIHACPQETAFEINIADDRLNIMPTHFLRQDNKGCIGIVKKAPLYKPTEETYYTNYLYQISEKGDTVSYEFSKRIR